MPEVDARANWVDVRIECMNIVCEQRMHSKRHIREKARTEQHKYMLRPSHSWICDTYACDNDKYIMYEAREELACERDSSWKLEGGDGGGTFLRSKLSSTQNILRLFIVEDVWIY